MRYPNIQAVNTLFSTTPFDPLTYDPLGSGDWDLIASNLSAGRSESTNLPVAQPLLASARCCLGEGWLCAFPVRCVVNRHRGSHLSPLTPRFNHLPPCPPHRSPARHLTQLDGRRARGPLTNQISRAVVTWASCGERPASPSESHDAIGRLCLACVT